MIQGRTVILLALAAGGYWLWYSGEWRTLAARIPALAEMTGVQPEAAAAEISTDRVEEPPAPLQVRTWTDADGVVHFEQAASAPRDARNQVVGTGGTLADYEKALEEKEGITLQDIARARAARERQASEAAAKEEAPQPVDDGNPVPGATQQARELMQRYDDAMDKIRNQNNH